MKKNERFFWISALITAIIVFTFIFFTNKAKSDNDENDQYLYARIFEKTLNIVRNNYVDVESVKPKDLYFGAIDGLLNSLKDEHTNFLSPKVWKELHESLSGQFEGLGIHIGLKDNWLTVIAPIEGTPAFKAGLQPATSYIK